MSEYKAMPTLIDLEIRAIQAEAKLAIALEALESYSQQEIENEQRAKDYAIKMNTQRTAMKALKEIKKLSDDDDWKIVD